MCVENVNVIIGRPAWEPIPVLGPRHQRHGCHFRCATSHKWCEIIITSRMAAALLQIFEWNVRPEDTQNIWQNKSNRLSVRSSKENVITVCSTIQQPSATGESTRNHAHPMHRLEWPEYVNDDSEPREDFFQAFFPLSPISLGVPLVCAAVYWRI